MIDAGASTSVGIYFMYDVKQADPAEWSSPPFEAKLVDKPFGKVVMGRGAVNQKGPEATFLAALHALPADVLGAAELDNCGWWARTVYVIIPMLRGPLVNLLILSFIGKMMIFDLVWIMTAGGPLWSTETVSTYVYKRAFDWNTFDLGYPSAIAVLWFAIILAFVALMTGLFRQRERLEF